MNYQKIYDDLISRGQSRSLEGNIYYERHHIVPRCLGGTDDIENLVNLTASEHYIAHQLLVKLNPGNSGLVWAAILMATHPQGGRITNKLYSWLRHQNSLVMRGKPKSEEHKKKIGDGNRGKVVSLETREKMRQVQLGKSHSEETKKKLSELNKGRVISDEARKKSSEKQKGRIFSDEHKANLSNAGMGRIFSKESKLKMSIASKGKPKSEEHRLNISKGNKGKKYSPERIANMVAGKKTKKLLKQDALD